MQPIAIAKVKWEVGVKTDAHLRNIDGPLAITLKRNKAAQQLNIAPQAAGRGNVIDVPNTLRAPTRVRLAHLKASSKL